MSWSYINVERKGIGSMITQRKRVYLDLKLIKTDSYLLQIYMGPAGRRKLLLSLFGIKKMTL